METVAALHETNTKAVKNSLVQDVIKEFFRSMLLRISDIFLHSGESFLNWNKSRGNFLDDRHGKESKTF